jgi:hypothetical protein
VLSHRKAGDLLLSKLDVSMVAVPASCARFAAVVGLPLLKDVRNW